VDLGAFGQNVVFDVIQYATDIDAATLKKMDNKKSPGRMSVNDILNDDSIRG